MNLVSDDTSNGRSSLVHAFAKDVQSPGRVGDEILK